MNYRSIKIAIMFGIVIMLLVLATVGFYGLRQLTELNEGRQTLKRTHDVLTALHSMLAIMDDAETGQRGFLITGNESYLSPYNSAVFKVNAFITQLKHLIANDVPSSEITNLSALISQKLVELDKTIELRRAKGFDAARELVLTDHGKEQMDLIRHTLTQMYVHENKLLLERRQLQDEQARTTFFSLFFVFGVAIILQVILGFMTLRFLERERIVKQALTESEKGYREQAELLDLSRDAILVRDLDGKIIYWNRGAEAMYGFQKNEAIGHVSHALLETKFPQPLAQLEEHLLSKGYWEDEVLQHTKEGKRLIVSSRHTLKTDLQGKPEGILEINTDITAHKQAEQRQIALAEMKRVNTELELFSSAASHDLQEPLRAISGCLQILEKSYKDKLEGDAAQLIQYAVDGAARMSALINDLLTLSRVSRSEVKRESTDLSEVVDRALQNIEISVKESGAIITCDSLPVLTAEKTLLVQLFQNLLANAIKFCKDKNPEIHISANKKDDHWEICVRDNGIGFEKQYADQIFQPFKRLHGSNEYPGTGIGLAICNRIVQRHGGTIWAESEPGKGTAFYFTLVAIS